MQSESKVKKLKSAFVRHSFTAYAKWTTAKCQQLLAFLLISQWLLPTH